MGSPLSPRELEVLEHVSTGADNLKIAGLLGITERTVKAHVHSLYRKLQVESRIEMALQGRRLAAESGRAGGALPPPRRDPSFLEILEDHHLLRERLRTNIEIAYALSARLRQCSQDHETERAKLVELVQSIKWPRH